MKKPETETAKHWDWDKCTAWVEHLLGYSIRDTLGKFTSGKVNPNTEYRDFWHLVVERCGVHNGCYIYLDREIFSALLPWQEDILRTYLAEFGEGPYWCEW